MTPTFHLLSEQQLESILECTFRLLDESGVRIDHPEGRELLQKAGARLDAQRAYLPRKLILQALETVPHRITVYNRVGEPAMQLEGRNAYYGAHTDAPDILDPFTGLRRPCLEHDVANTAHLAEALPNISFLTVSGMVADCPAQFADRIALAQCLIHSAKPVLVMPTSAAALVDICRMASLAVGGAATLEKRPNLIIYAEPVSPLTHPDESIQKLLYCAKRRLPIAYSPYAARGGTAPIGQAAILAQLTAESLSALVIHQLKRPGAPFIFGGMASIMDMRTTIFSYGAPEFQAGNTMMAEMAHYLDLPNFGTGGTSDSQVFDGQALIEATTSCMLAHLCGAHLVHDIGLLGSATILMPEMIVVSDQIAAMFKAMFGEVGVEPNNLAMEQFSNGILAGNYISDSETLAHFREIWYPPLFYRGGAKRWAKGDVRTFDEQINKLTRELIEQPSNNCLPASVVEQIRQVLQEFAGQ